MRMEYLKWLGTGFGLLALLTGCSPDSAVESMPQEQPSAAAVSSTSDSPQYEVDASWPQPLPNDWILGQVSGIAIDGEDNVWIK